MLAAMDHVAGESVRGIRLLKPGEERVNQQERLQKVEKDVEEIKAMVGMLCRKDGLDPNSPAKMELVCALQAEVLKGGGMFKTLMKVFRDGKEHGIVGIGPSQGASLEDALKNSAGVLVQ